MILEAIRQRVATWVRSRHPPEPRLRVRFVRKNGHRPHLEVSRRDAKGRLEVFLLQIYGIRAFYAVLPNREAVEAALGPDYSYDEVIDAIEWAGNKLWRKTWVDLIVMSERPVR